MNIPCCKLDFTIFMEGNLFFIREFKICQFERKKKVNFFLAIMVKLTASLPDNITRSDLSRDI